jgi:hypothetical protein
LKEASSTVLAVRRNRILAITSPRRRIGRDDEDIPVAVERLHTVAGDLERVGVLVVDLREADLVPALTDGKAAIVEEAAGSRLGEADQRDGLGPAPRAAAVTSWVKSSKVAPVASSTLAMLSVVGQRGRPLPVTRFDLLNDVGSRPARLARPEADRP